MPKALFTNERYKDLTDGAKILYELMLDRMGLSVKNRWLDSQDRVYIIFTLEDVQEYINCIMALGIFAYNLLRIIGQESLKNNDYPPTVHKVKRRRIRTVIDRYICLAVKFVRHARSVFVKMSETNPWLASFRRMYTAFSL